MCSCINCVWLFAFIVYTFFHICDPLSEKPHCSHNLQFFLISSALSTVFKEWVFKFELNQASRFEVIALDSRASKKIALYGNHTENKLQAPIFSAITFDCICLQCCNLA